MYFVNNTGETTTIIASTSGSSNPTRTPHNTLTVCKKESDAHECKDRHNIDQSTQLLHRPSITHNHFTQDLTQ